MKLQIPRLLAFATMIMMAAVIVFGSRSDTRTRLAQTEEMMTAQGNAIAAIVAESNRHGLDVFAKWEDETKGRLLDNANWLAWVNTQRNLSDSDLDKFAKDLNLWRIMFFNAQGKLEKSSLPEGGNRQGAGQVPSEFLLPLVSGHQHQGVLDQRRARIDGQPRLAAGVTRPGRGAVILVSHAGPLDQVNRDLRAGHLIKVLGQTEGLRYVVLQDRTGILASSTLQVEFNLPADDPSLLPLQEGAEFVTREFPTAEGPVFEVSRLQKVDGLVPDDRSVLLRVGLDATLLNELRADTRRRAVLRLLLFMGSLILMSILLLAWQRQGVLNREVNKVTWELRMREEESRRSGKLVAMGNLAAGVAHQIRNPLNTIHMIAQALGRNEELPEEVTLQARHIQSESGRIENIVQQFLDFARPREPVFETLNLGRLVRETVAIHQSANTSKEIEFRVAAPDCEAELDRQFVIEIVENLVRNAAEALQGGQAGGQCRITVTLTCDRQMAELVVEDTGPGIPADFREKVFDLYFTTKPSGSGLGLGLVSRMVTAMGGHFSLDNLIDGPGGARFLIQFPLQRSKQ